MTSKRVNWLFFTMIMTHIAVSLFLSLLGMFVKVGITVNFFLGQAIIMAPTLLFLLFSRQKPQPARKGMFCRIRISSLLMIALCTFLIMPLVTVLNALTMFFTDNAVVSVEGDILNVPFPVMLFMIGIFGPFCEEFVFRGVVYGSYSGWSETGGASGNTERRSGGFWPIMLSALTFGLMHMNFNQAVYAFGIGVFLAILVEAAGSLWASVFCHMLFNSYQVVLMYVSRAFLGSAYAETVSRTAQELTSADLQAALAFPLVAAAVATPIAGCCVAWIAKNEGRQEALRALFRPAAGGTQRQPLLTVPLVVTIVLCLGFMSLDWFLVDWFLNK